MHKKNLNSILFAGQKTAILTLENGNVFQGISIGYDGNCVGEIVFNTAMSGYQEILSDPSYAEQIVTLTYPHIGNTGCNSNDNESTQTHVKGLVIKDLPKLASSWRKQETLQQYLISNKIVAIAGLDTRELTKTLRSKGAMKACIMTQAINESQAIENARSFAGLKNMDLAIKVTCKKSYQWQQEEFEMDANDFRESIAGSEKKYKVVCYDYGVKHNILRILASLGCDITVVPANITAKDVLAMKPDGIFLSNGPGDPAACDYAITAVTELLKTSKKTSLPIFGICLGHQILALASGANTTKMKFGHHGANHPVQDLSNKEVMITSQNHGFAVASNNLPECLQVTHISLFDGSIQGIKRTDCFAYSFQGHPEASPGPHDAKKLFLPFINKMKENNNA
ncbi:Carbamoyl-phosphate synthase small chain [hydrothermal vent metagenome]|uniref:carbamoyl-phosphate synthase (glutamine-hydrolyzing) n=1 Tax=hydrothermal vent metagenome TaxID=652676 RepID=A0A3B0UY38_9ZZZZ